MSLSSAGILYVYINGYKDNGMLYIEQADSYHYIGDDLYRSIMEKAKYADEYENIVHIFAVIGVKDKANAVFSVFENEMKANFQRILSNKKIKVKSKYLDDVGNSFFRCVQEFYCEQLNHFPKRIYHTYDNIVIGGICCSYISDEEGGSIAHEIVSLWLERENPMLCGHQIMTRSFFISDFADRKMIAAIPDYHTGLWRLIFEGGHQMYLSENAPYTKETLHSKDIGAFCSSNLQSILMNPIYAYGKWFQPNDICEEWHKVFLYLCAISDIDWNRNIISKVYEKFLLFLEKNICLIMDAPTYISKEQYCDVLCMHINTFRSFLKGNDEAVISKDLHQTLNSRYVYLPYLWSLVKINPPVCSFSYSELQPMISGALIESDIYKKGVLWEDVAAYILSNIPGRKITGRRIKAGSQEIDLSVVNISLDNDLWQLGAYILIECKTGTHM